MRGVVFTHPSVATYHTPGHPEAPWRVSRTAELLRKSGFVVEPPPVRATSDDVLTVHSPEHWSALQSGLFFDPDTPAHDGIDQIALTSLSGALSAADAALAGTPAFSLMRPPGHHAGRERIAGFCYLNNIAIAVERLVRSGRTVAILDIDVHHGDGTESIALGRPGWFFVSLHQVPLYPGTGTASQDNCLNFPLPPGTGETTYLATLDRALDAIRRRRPDLLAVSAGFDTHRDCPIAGLQLETSSYRAVGSRIAALGLPRFATLEGGYAAAVPEAISEFLRGFFT
jgi:acetoin utilization deacetylase AcuC-like enzyme